MALLNRHTVNCVEVCLADLKKLRCSFCHGARVSTDCKAQDTEALGSLIVFQASICLLLGDGHVR